ncbi:MAG: hypothetical protein QXI97_07110 [Nitrososphaerota archaeon]
MPRLHKDIQVAYLEDILENEGGFDLSPLSYPTSDSRLWRKRVIELLDLGVKELVLRGVGDLLKPVVLGKGYRSIVLFCRSGGLDLAAKVRRADSPPTDFPLEAYHISIASGLGVGPKLYSWSPDMIVMEMVEGIGIGQVLRESRGTLPLGDVMDLCFRMDTNGLDHGQLSDPSHHIMLSGRGPVIIDYGHTSMARKPRNLTSFISYILNRLGMDARPYASLLRKYASDYDVNLYEVLKRRVLGNLGRLK